MQWTCPRGEEVPKKGRILAKYVIFVEKGSAKIRTENIVLYPRGRRGKNRLRREAEETAFSLQGTQSASPKVIRELFL